MRRNCGSSYEFVICAFPGVLHDFRDPVRVHGPCLYRRETRRGSRRVQQALQAASSQRRASAACARRTLLHAARRRNRCSPLRWLLLPGPIAQHLKVTQYKSRIRVCDTYSMTIVYLILQISRRTLFTADLVGHQRFDCLTHQQKKVASGSRTETQIILQSRSII